MTHTAKQIAHYKAEILSKLPQGWTVGAILKQEGMCSRTYFFAELVAKDIEFQNQYARALELRADFWAEELIEIADEGKNDWMTRTYGDTEVDVPNPEVVARSKLRVETRKWVIGKASPKKYGDKLDVKHSGDPDNPIATTVVYLPANGRETKPVDAPAKLPQHSGKKRVSN